MKELFREIISRETVPEKEEYMELLEKVNEVFQNEEAGIRPPADTGEPGGIIHLLHGIPTMIVPDLHGRRGFISALFNFPEFLSLMENGLLQVVCVGDGFHRELDAKERWLSAYSEFEKGYKKHRFMDSEMTDSLGLMEMIIRLKCAFPGNFHFLKGNHENVKNEETGGDHPFRKFALEGEMVHTWVSKFMGEDFLESYSRFEKALPLLAIGENFLISHAEPVRFFSASEIRNYSSEAIHGLTWTANGEAEQGSVRDMLDFYLPARKIEEKKYFGGHRIISEKYRLRADGLYIQIHNPWNYQVAYVQSDRVFNPEEDIIDLSGNG